MAQQTLDTDKQEQETEDTDTVEEKQKEGMVKFRIGCFVTFVSRCSRESSISRNP